MLPIGYNVLMYIILNILKSFLQNFLEFLRRNVAKIRRKLIIFLNQ